MVAGASTEYALSLSVPLSFLGVSLVYVVADQRLLGAQTGTMD